MHHDSEEQAMDSTVFDFFEARPLATSIVAIIGILSLTKIIRSYWGYWSDQKYGASLGCRDPRVQPARWPFGVDLVLDAIRAANSQHLLRWFLGVNQEFGPTFVQYALGSRGLNTIEPRNVEALLSTQFEDFGIGPRQELFAPLLGEGIFTQDGPAWKHSREMLRPQFLGNRGQNFVEIQEHTENLLDNIPEGVALDLQPLFFRYTIDTTTFLLFGKSIFSLKAQDNTAKEIEFTDAFNKSQAYMAQRMRLGPFYWTVNGRKLKETCATVHRFVDDIVKKATSERYKMQRPEESKNYVLIESLLNETQDLKVIRYQLLHILLAGRDTTASYLAWTVRLLARHPSVLDRLRAEIETSLGLGDFARRPDRADLKKLTYLGLVLKEVLRLFPPAPANARFCTKTTTLPLGGGPDGKSPILVRKGEAVGYAIYAMHRRKDLYGQDAESFRPERWEARSDNEVDLKSIGWGYLPFNGGPRVCLGQDFAMLEASYALVRLIQRYPYCEVPEGDSGAGVGDEEQLLTLTMSSGEGCWVRMRSKRNADQEIFSAMANIV